MKITESEIHREGFAVLHGKWGGSSKSGILVGVNGKRIGHWELGIGHLSIGYLAYPNPNLKNDIPDSRFYRYQNLKKMQALPQVSAAYKTSGRLQQSVSKSEYIKKIRQIKELLAAGEIYQLNYAIRFRKKFSGSPYALFLRLAQTNPSDFSAYLNCGDFQIISNSPERLFHVRNGKIMTQPIKGTARKSNLSFPRRRESRDLLDPRLRGGDIEDKNLISLLNSEKERAELDMITDLERNDVGRICRYGTLRLTKERAILELPNLWHTYSEVWGALRSDVGCQEIISAMFPGGSITGCPKKRAMQYIEKMESLPRNIFTGSIGWIESGQKSNVKSQMCVSMDFNITIRTALVHDGYIEYWAGGGITADSDPEKEYDECLLKAEKFLKLL